MDVIAVFTRYVARFLKAWIFWFWFFALDAVALISETFLPETSKPPRWLYWAIAGIGFLIGNVKVFFDVDSENKSLKSRIKELSLPDIVPMCGMQDFVENVYTLPVRNEGKDSAHNVKIRVGATTEVIESSIERESQDFLQELFPDPLYRLTRGSILPGEEVRFEILPRQFERFKNISLLSLAGRVVLQCEFSNRSGDKYTTWWMCPAWGVEWRRINPSEECGKA